MEPRISMITLGAADLKRAVEFYQDANKARRWSVISVDILSEQWAVDCGVLIEKNRRTSALIRGFFS